MECSKPNEASSRRQYASKVMDCKPKVLSKRKENALAVMKPKDTGTTKKIGSSSNQAVSGMENRRPKDISMKKRENVQCGTKPKHPYLKSQSGGNLAGNHTASRMEHRKQNESNSGRQNASKAMGCKHKVLPTIRENVPAGIQSKNLSTSRKIVQEVTSWDLTGKLRKVTAQLKEAKEKEKELKNKSHKFAKESETEEQEIENIQLLIPDENILKQREFEVTMVSEQLKMIELQVLQKQKEVNAILNNMDWMELKGEDLENIMNELKESKIFLKEKISIQDKEILKVKLDTKELDNELEELIHNYHFHKSFLESISSEVKILEDCAKSMEMSNDSVPRGLRKNLLKRLPK